MWLRLSFFLAHHCLCKNTDNTHTNDGIEHQSLIVNVKTRTNSLSLYSFSTICSLSSALQFFYWILYSIVTSGEVRKLTRRMLMIYRVSVLNNSPITLSQFSIFPPHFNYTGMAFECCRDVYLNPTPVSALLAGLDSKHTFIYSSYRQKAFQIKIKSLVFLKSPQIST